MARARFMEIDFPDGRAVGDRKDTGSFLNEVRKAREMIVERLGW